MPQAQGSHSSHGYQKLSREGKKYDMSLFMKNAYLCLICLIHVLHCHIYYIRSLIFNHSLVIAFIYDESLIVNFNPSTLIGAVLCGMS